MSAYEPDDYGTVEVRDVAPDRPTAVPAVTLPADARRWVGTPVGLRTAGSLTYLMPDASADERVGIEGDGRIRLNAPAVRATGASVGDAIRPVKCAGRWLRLEVIEREESADLRGDA